MINIYYLLFVLCIKHYLLSIYFYYFNKILSSNKIKKLLKHKTTVFTGQTGAGKSSLMNKLDKSLNFETNEISKA